MSRKFLDNCLYTVNRLYSNSKGLSFAARRDYILGTKQMIRALHVGGYQVSHIRHLKERHIDYLQKQWQEQGLSTGTMKNRLSQLRFVAKAINKPTLLPKLNKELGVEQRRHISANNKAIHEIDILKFDDRFIRYSVQLQQHFGLRREEAIKFIASRADRGDYITLQASWTKGGIERDIPITTLEQRALIDEIKAFAGQGNSLIPEGKTYASQRNLYDAQVYKSGYHNLHGLRHAYAQRHYQELVNELTQGKGWPSPQNGGKSQREMTPEERDIDRQARLILSNHLGHSREDVTRIYC